MISTHEIRVSDKIDMKPNQESFETWFWHVKWNSSDEWRVLDD